MENQEILDEIKDELQTEKDLKKTERKIALYLLAFTLFNGVVFSFIYKGELLQNFYTAFMGLVIGFTAIGFAIGAIFALFPYQGFSYKKRYFRTALLCTLILQMIYCGMLLILSVMSWNGMW